MFDLSWSLPAVLKPEKSEDAVVQLQRYFASTPEGLPAFSGSRFERFAGGGDTADVANTFTSSDLTAITLLSVHVPGQAALRILGDTDPVYHQTLSELLSMVPTNIDLADADDAALERGGELWSLLRTNKNVGPTKTSKLLARKRPKLFPVIDTVVKRQLGHGLRTDFYATLRESLRGDGSRLEKHLKSIRADAGIGNDISVIRCFDILVWMSARP